jgi:hypothetical protein
VASTGPTVRVQVARGNNPIATRTEEDRKASRQSATREASRKDVHARRTRLHRATRLPPGLGWPLVFDSDDFACSSGAA